MLTVRNLKKIIILEAGNTQERAIKARKADTNLFAVTFDGLSGQPSIHTGDPVVCTNSDCNAVLSHISEVTNTIAEMVCLLQ